MSHRGCIGVAPPGRRAPAAPLGFRVVFGALALVILAACATASPYAGMETDELWAAGVEAYEAGEWEDAIQALNQMVNQNPGNPRNPEARMYIARAHAERGEHITAAAEFERFLQLHGNHGLAPEASLGACLSYAELAPIPPRDQTYTRRARDACRQTAFEFQGLSVAATADSIQAEMVDQLGEKTYQEGRFYQRRGLHDSAIFVFEDVVAQYSNTQWAPHALAAMYRSYEELGWEREAEEALDRLLGRYPDSEPALELMAERGIEDPAALGDGGL